MRCDNRACERNQTEPDSFQLATLHPTPLRRGASLRCCARKNERGAEREEIRIPPRKDAAWQVPLERRSALHGYRSVLGLLKYSRDCPAIITTAIATPASNEIVSIIILVAHLCLRGAFFRHRVTNCQFSSFSSLRIVRSRSEPHLQGEVFQERCGKPVECKRATGSFPCVVMRFDYARLAKESPIQARVRNPNVTPGSSLSKLFCAIRSAATFPVCSVVS